MKNLVYRGYALAANDNKSAKPADHPLMYRGSVQDRKAAQDTSQKARLFYRGTAAKSA